MQPPNPLQNGIHIFFVCIPFFVGTLQTYTPVRG
nr:MAG TPA: hypothetical protein [Caudoviricetes sp.]